MGKMRKQAMVFMVLVMVVSLLSPAEARAAKKKTIKLNKTSLVVYTGKSKTVKIKNSTGKKIKKVTWKVLKGKNLIKLTKKTKKSVKIKALKKTGKAIVQAKIKTASKTYKKKVTVRIKMKKSESSKQTVATATPGSAGTTDATSSSATSTPSPTEEPDTTVELLHYNMTTGEDGKTLLDQSGNGKDAELVGVDPTIQVDHSLFLENGGYINLPSEVFEGQDTLTISIWAKDYNGTANTSVMYVGTTETLPNSYWLLNPRNLEGRMKSVMTNSVNVSQPWTTEVGISASTVANGINGPFTGTEWNHYVTVIKPDSITGYFNGEKVGTCPLERKFSDFGSDLVAYIGKSSYSDPTFIGYVREVQVFRGAKPDSAITKLYKETKEADMEARSAKSDVFIADRADPYITKGEDGYYYFTASYPMNGFHDANGYDRVILRRSKTLAGLKNAEEKTIFKVSSTTISHRFIWAPEMHYIGGKWYILYAGSGSSSNWWNINCNVLMCEGDDPYNDNWVEKGKFQAADGDSTSFTDFSLDMTYFECNGKSYVIWAQKIGTSNLYIAEVDPNEPWKAVTKAMLLTKPEYYWECVSIPVNEGPSVLQHDGKVIVAYSAAATGPEYCVGYLYADEKSDLLDIKSWTKQSTPALTSEDLVDEYGPGHNSFTVDENGDAIFVYHSRPKDCFEGNCGYSSEDPLYDPCRSAHLRRVIWDENGLPILNAQPYELN